MAIIKKMKAITSFDKLEPSHIAGGIVNGAATVESSSEVSQYIKDRITI